jgi:signal transduction histidine kinase/uncharacterized protein YigA (DUF484 family)
MRRRADEAFYSPAINTLPRMSQAPSLPVGSEDMSSRRVKSLARIYELTSGLMNVEDTGSMLKTIAESVRELFGFDLVSISVLDDKSQSFTQHFSAGYSEEEEREIVTHPEVFSKDDISTDFRDEFKIQRITYFVPVERQGYGLEEFALVRDREAALRPRVSPDSWHELDLLYFALLSRRGELIGFLQADYPCDGKLPSVQIVQEIELFATLAAVAIENHNLYKRAADLLQEIETKTTGTLKILDLLRSVIRVDDLDIVLQKVSDAMVSTFDFRIAGVSLFTKGSDRVTVHALTGYTEEEEKAVRAGTILKSKVLEDFREEFRVTKTGYFIPGEKQGNGRDFVFVGNPDAVTAPRRSSDSWHELDLLYFGMYDREGDILGYIQPDYPRNGKIPTKETMEAMEAFASIATIAVENSSMFKYVEDARNQVRMYLDLLTHDVGNLINPVNAYLEVVMGTTELSPVQYKYLSSAQEAARSITHLVRNVRRSAQMLETTGVELVPSNLTRSVRQSASDAKNAYISKKVEIGLNLPEQEIWVMADSLLDDVIYNLLTNAIKYDEHEEIEVDVEMSIVDFEGRKHARVRVVDRGIGIPDEFKDKVFSRDFKKLVMAERPILQKFRGAGMGLSLVKALVERYGGKIWVENRVYDDPSRGSVFAFVLPLT